MLVGTEELVVLTHILVPLSNPHINIYFCYRLDGLFFLFALKGQHVLTSHRALPKVVPKSPGKQQRPLRASAAADVAVSQETGKRNKNITPGDWPGGNPLVPARPGQPAHPQPRRRQAAALHL